MDELKRAVAQKIRISDLTDQKRVNIIGAVIEKADKDNFKNLIIDDGISKISVGVFEDSPIDIININVGSIIMVIGKPREYGNEKYIVAEIVKEVNPGWAKLRKLEFELASLSQKESPIEFIKTQDKGQGVEIMKIDTKFGEDSAKKLIAKGELIEVSPGIVRVL